MLILNYRCRRLFTLGEMFQKSCSTVIFGKNQFPAKKNDVFICWNLVGSSHFKYILNITNLKLWGTKYQQREKAHPNLNIVRFFKILNFRKIFQKSWKRSVSFKLHSRRMYIKSIDKMQMVTGHFFLNLWTYLQRCMVSIDAW